MQERERVRESIFLKLPKKLKFIRPIKKKLKFVKAKIENARAEQELRAEQRPF